MVKVWYVAVVLEGQHSLGYIVAELWAFSQVHGHCGARSDVVGVNFFLGESQACFANGAYGITEGIDHLPGRDMFDGAVGHVGGDDGVG
jgi:hypothetical protein